MKKSRVPFSYLDRQFANIDDYLAELRTFVQTGDFTLGKPLEEFERRVATLHQTAFGIGLNSGTDAITFPLKMLGIGPGDEVITTPMTFIATVGAIVASGATPVFVDSEDGFVIDTDKIENAITSRTKAIVPVHYTGNIADMPKIQKIAQKHRLKIIEDACQAFGGAIEGKPVGSWADAAAFSFHPLKNLNVWSDGGMAITNDPELTRRLRLYRNHGLVHRDEVEFFGVNSRFDTIQAVIGNRLIQQTRFITEQKIRHAAQLDDAFRDIPEIRIPVRRPGVKHVYHLYLLRVERRDELHRYLNEQGIEAKIHYPKPVHLQKGAAFLGYEKGSFPKCESDCHQIITLPGHQHLTVDELSYMIETVRDFYKRKTSASSTQSALQHA